MTSFSKKTQIQLVNSFVGNHDLCCDCSKPALHCLQTICNQLKDELTTTEKQEIIKCLGTTTTDADPGDVDGEDLERLFAEDTGDDDGYVQKENYLN